MRGRSCTLKVCYRTSRQIRAAADRLLPERLRDVDGLEDERIGTVSVFEGPAPIVAVCDDVRAEEKIVATFLQNLGDDIVPEEIGIFYERENCFLLRHPQSRRLHCPPRQRPR